MVNYIHLINWFWEDVPYRPGYKSEYGTLFLALVDSINRNGWRAETAVDFERILNKSGLEKRMYLRGRIWLAEQELITFTEGSKHGNARFGLTDALLVKVQNCTLTVPRESIERTQSVPQVYPESTQSGTQSVPIIDKPINRETTKPSNLKPSNQREGRENAPRDPLDENEEVLALSVSTGLPRTPTMISPSQAQRVDPPKAPPTKPVVIPSGYRGPYGDGQLRNECKALQAEEPGLYSESLYKAFLAYWTAPVQTGAKADIGKELWRTQKTFMLAGRLATWKKRDDDYTQTRPSQSSAAFRQAAANREPATDYGDL